MILNFDLSFIFYTKDFPMNLHHYKLPSVNVYGPDINFFPYPGRILGALDNNGLI